MFEYSARQLDVRSSPATVAQSRVRDQKSSPVFEHGYRTIPRAYCLRNISRTRRLASTPRYWVIFASLASELSSSS